MITLDISYEEAVALLDRAVEEKGADYVYPADENGHRNCVYFEGEGRAPSCIMGYVLEYIDPEIKDDLEVTLNLDIEGVLDAATEDHFAIRDLFARAQGAQDGGTPWGEAVELAKAERR